MLYLDASALVKRYIAEPGSELVREAMATERGRWAMCRIGFVETVRAVGLAHGDESVQRVRDDWRAIGVIEVNDQVARKAAELAVDDGLRPLDAIHLAAALRLPAEDLTLATWDRRLHVAARERGLATLPASLSCPESEARWRQRAPRGA